MSSRSFSPLGAAAEKPALLRQLGLFSATALVVSNMVGTGIFTSTGFLAADLGSAPLILAIWVVGALCALAGAFCYSELGVNFPSSGGEYVYLTQAYGPSWGFMTGWISFFAGFSAPIAAAGLAFAGYLGYFFPNAMRADAPFSIAAGPWSWRFGGAQFAASALIALFTVLNLFGVQRAARVQNLLTAFKVSVIAAFIVLGFAAGSGDWTHFSTPAARESATPLGAQFAVSLFWIYVAYSGWNAATYVAEELERPSRTLPMALALGTGAVAVLFLALNIVFIYAVPLEKMKGVVAVGALAASYLFGQGAAGIFSGLMAAGLLSTVNAMVTVGPRVYYAMAKNRAFLAAAARVHPRWRTPVIAIAAQGLCAVALTFAPFRDLVSYIGILLNFFAVMSVLSLLKFRRRPGWTRLRVVSFAYPAIPLFFVLVGLWMTYQGVMREPKISAAAAGTIAAGAAFYRFRIHPAVNG